MLATIPMTKEIWKQVAGYEGLYEVSNLGRVKSLGHYVEQANRWGGVSTRIYKGKFLHPFMDTNGYPIVTLSNKNIKVHRLVAEAFIPNPLSKYGVNHIDGVKNNNKQPNLEWASGKDNMQHAIKRGLRAKSGWRKLTVNEINKIRDMAHKGVGRVEISKLFGVTTQTIGRTINRLRLIDV